MRPWWAEDDRVQLKPITVSKLMDNAVEVSGGFPVRTAS